MNTPDTSDDLRNSTQPNIGEWYRQFRDSLTLHLTVKGLADEADAEDIVNEVFEVILRLQAAGSLNVRYPQSYLQQACERRATNQRRGRRRAKLVPLEGVPEPSTPPFIIRTCSDLKKTVAEMLSTLPVDQRTVVELRYFDGLKNHVIADRLEVPETTVQNRLSRAKALLACFDQAPLKELRAEDTW